MSRSLSASSLSSLLDTVPLTTAQCMVPSEHSQLNMIVEQAYLAWNEARDRGEEDLHCKEFECPQNVLSLYSNVRELSRDEEHCRLAYIRLVYNLAIQVIQDMHPVEPVKPVWMKLTPANSQLVPKHKTETYDLETVQKKVQLALIRGQLPSLLPPVKFLQGTRRVGGKEVDFVDSILIHELRKEEPGWVDYGQDEATMKLRVADAILDSLLSETVQVLNTIQHNRKTRCHS